MRHIYRTLDTPVPRTSIKLCVLSTPLRVWLWNDGPSGRRPKCVQVD